MRIAYLHGFAGDPAAWGEVIAALPPHEARAVALPGHGGGPVAPTWDACLAAIADAAGEIDAAVGYSLGARAALGLAATGRVARAILVGVNPGIAEADRAARRAGDAAWARLLRERGVAAFAEAWEAQPLFATQARAGAERLAARRARRIALDPAELARSLEVMGLAEMPDYRGAAARLVAAGRIALIAGAEDAKFSAIARELAAAAPERALTLIEGSGHDPTLEQPARLAAAIAAIAGLGPA